VTFNHLQLVTTDEEWLPTRTFDRVAVWIEKHAEEVKVELKSKTGRRQESLFSGVRRKADRGFGSGKVHMREPLKNKKWRF